ncbi:T6SS immunity protein Tdi1 domain-containing protein [Frigoribacterium endophyticum]|uniref:T6SS immunity protein Tdi1 domain-containing protein n=1 Tax=Frigoribacterium endophyticum TaxID=1522176 RepID=UPI0014218C53|nr:T6SS immunity protein Tdi1 domain-containing protein [Frigoribacterium endophyticum]
MIPVPTEATFRSGPPVPRSSLETFSGTVPARAAALWGEHGLGQTAGGYLRIVDPAQWVDVLAEAAPRFAQGVPLFSSALGDLFVWLGEHLHVLEFRSGTSRILTNSLDTFVVIAAYESFLQDPDYFDWAPWPEARELVGVPEADECLGSVPLPALGGTRSAETLQRVGMQEHVLLIASLAGPLG